MNGQSQEASGSGNSHNNNNNNSNKSHLPKEEVEKDKDKKVVKNDSSDEEEPVTDKNNNNIVNDDEQVPDGARGLPEEDVEMVDVNCGGRVLANQVAQAIEVVRDDSRAWFRLWMPDGEPGVVAVGLHTTVGEVNARLAAMFGEGVYFVGYRLVTGLTISAALALTMSQLDAMGLDLGVGTMAEDWYGESRED